MMRALVIVFLFGGVLGAPGWRGGREDGAEVIRIVDEKTPILLSGMTESDNMVVVDTVPEVKEVVNATVAEPTPVPESVAITTEKLAQNTPDLVPSVVDIATVAPDNAPPVPPQSPPVNGTGPSRPPPPPEEEDEEDSEEDAGSDEEAEEDEGDEEDEEGEDEEEDDEEDEEEDEEKGKALKKVVKREVNGEEVVESVKVKPVGGSVVIEGGSEGEDVRQSDEEDKDVGGKVGSGEGVTGVPSGLQGVSALSATGEDDEAESVLQGGSKGGGSVVLGKQ